MSKLLAFLRWVVILPGSLVGAIIVIFPIHWVLLFFEWQTAHSGDEAMVHDASNRPVPFLGIPFEMMERLCDAALVPATMLLTAAWIAPTAKRQTAIVVAFLIGVGYAVLYKFSELNVPLLQQNNWLIVVINVVSLIGTCFFVWK